MTESQYEEIIRNSLQRFRDLYAKREEIDIELVKLRQFLYATLNMVSDKERDRWEEDINDAVRRATTNAASLADSVRRVFEKHPHVGVTAGFMRQLLLESGFDFGAYTSNPLSSISTTLRRMVETGELETREDAEGTTLYFPSDRERKRKSEMLAAARAQRNKDKK